MKPVVLGMALLAASAAALAQPAPGTARPDPRDARAPVPSSDYQSPFVQYRPFAVQPPGPWRDVNDRVGRIGGWKAYAREAAQSPAAPVTGSPPTAMPAPASTPGLR